jgi:hypothetical protein
MYTDRRLAIALFDSLTPAEQKANPLPDTSDREVNARYFHNFLTGALPSAIKGNDNEHS